MMSRDNKPGHRRSIARSPIFWRALIVVIAGTSISAMLWLFRSYQAFSVIGMAVTQVGALVIGLLCVRQNRPVALGLLVGLLVIDLVVPIIISIAYISIMSGVRNF